MNSLLIRRFDLEGDYGITFSRLRYCLASAGRNRAARASLACWNRYNLGIQVGVKKLLEGLAILYSRW